MAQQPAGIDPPQGTDAWTRADIERWLKAAFRNMPFTPIFAPRSDVNTIRSLDPDMPSATFDIVAFTATVLGRKSDECRAVLVWARTMAAREAGEWSIAAFCDERDWHRRTFDRRRIRACEKIARAKNEADRDERRRAVKIP